MLYNFYILDDWDDTLCRPITSAILHLRLIMDFYKRLLQPFEIQQASQKNTQPLYFKHKIWICVWKWIWDYGKVMHVSVSSLQALIHCTLHYLHVVEPKPSNNSKRATSDMCMHWGSRFQFSCLLCRSMWNSINPCCSCASDADQPVFRRWGEQNRSKMM